MNVLVRSIKSIRFGRLDAHASRYLIPCVEPNCAYSVRSRGPRASHLGLLLGRAVCRRPI